MPGPPEQLVLRKGESTIQVPIDKAGGFIQQGYRPEAPAERQQRVGENIAKIYDPGVGGAFNAAVSRGATFGLSDVVGRVVAGEGYAKEQQAGQALHPVASTAGELAGGLAAGHAASGVGPAAKTVAGTVARGAVEGAAFGAGQYVSDVALGNKDLSAEGAVASLGHGALWGAASTGVVLGGNKALLAARKMFPAGDVTAASVRAAEGDAVAAISGARTEADNLSAAAQDRMRGIRTEMQADPAVAAEHTAVAANSAQELSAQVNPQAALEGVAPSEPPSEADSLLGKLQATKAQLNQGRSLGDVSRGIEDAVNAHAAKSNPEMAGLVSAEQELRESKAALDDHLAAWRGKYPGGMVDLDAMPAKARAAAIKEWAANATPQTGTDEAVIEKTLHPNLDRTPYRLNGGEGPISKVSTAPQAVNDAAKEAAAEAARSGYNEGLAQAVNISKGGAELSARANYAGKVAAAKAADNVYTAAQAAGPDINEQIRAAIRAKASPLDNSDLTSAVEAVTRFEKAHAATVEALGPFAPPESVPRAQAFRQAEQATAAKATTTAKAASDVGDAIDRKPGTVEKIMGMADKLGQASEVLRMLGVPVPDPASIPVIGPLLSLYLKARVGARILGGGLKVGATVDGEIAARAATVRNAVRSAAGSGIDAMIAGVPRALAAAPPTAEILSHALFNPRGKDHSDDDYRARSAELAEAQQPGAVEQAMRSKLGTTDEGMIQSATSALQRKLDYLEQTRPKPMAQEGIGEKQWQADKMAMDEWGRRVHAADDPTSVFGKLSRGQLPSAEELETVKAVYPQLWGEYQMAAVEHLATSKQEIPYGARTRMSVVLGMPIDSGVSASFGGFVAYKPPPPAPTPGVGKPTKSNIGLGQRVGNRTDQP